MLSESERVALVEAIHASPTQLVLAVTGGGQAVITDLLNVAGASATVLEIIVPYSADSLSDLVAGHGDADSAVSAETAISMAAACLARATQLAPNTSRVLGVACTAAIATTREKRGEHRAHIAIVGHSGTVATEAVELTKGQLNRVEEDRSIADSVLCQLAAVAAI